MRTVQLLYIIMLGLGAIEMDCYQCSIEEILKGNISPIQIMLKISHSSSSKRPYNQKGGHWPHGPL